jgi:hypothetical protein
MISDFERYSSSDSHEEIITSSRTGSAEAVQIN